MRYSTVKGELLLIDKYRLLDKGESLQLLLLKGIQVFPTVLYSHKDNFGILILLRVNKVFQHWILAVVQQSIWHSQNPWNNSKESSKVFIIRWSHGDKAQSANLRIR